MYLLNGRWERRSARQDWIGLSIFVSQRCLIWSPYYKWYSLHSYQKVNSELYNNCVHATEEIYCTPSKQYFTFQQTNLYDPILLECNINCFQVWKYSNSVPKLCQVHIKKWTYLIYRFIKILQKVKHLQWELRNLSLLSSGSRRSEKRHANMALYV